MLLETFLSADTLTSDRLLLTTRSEGLLLLARDTASGTSRAGRVDGAGSVIVTVVVTGSMTGGTTSTGTSSTSLGLGGKGSELALSFDTVLVLLDVVSC